MRCTICGEIEGHHEGVHRSWERLEEDRRVRVGGAYVWVVDRRMLRRVRMQAGKTQDWVGKNLGYSTKSISNWETGRHVPSPHIQLEWNRLLRSLG